MKEKSVFYKGKTQFLFFPFGKIFPFPKMKKMVLIKQNECVNSQLYSGVNSFSFSPVTQKEQ